MVRETFTTDDPEADRIARLIAELDPLPSDERKAAIAALSEKDREAVRAVELEESDMAAPDDEGELGAEG